MEQLIFHVKSETKKLREVIRDIVCKISMEEGNLQTEPGKYSFILVGDIEGVINEIVAGLKHELKLQ